MTQLLALTGHLLHVVVVLGGLAGMAAIFAPRLADRAGLLRAPDSPLDRRLADLRSRAAAGTLASGAEWNASGAALLPGGGPLPAGDPGRPERVASAAGDPLLAAAVVGSAAAAGVHAAVGPMHLGTYPVLAVGFLVAAVLQAVWPLAVLAPARPEAPPGARAAAGGGDGVATRLAVAGLLLHGGCVAAWLVSRTVGLPLGLHGAGAQPVGPWDLAAVAWQLVALAWCVGHLLGRRHASGSRSALHPGWGTRGARAFVGASALVLVLLTLSGAAA